MFLNEFADGLAPPDMSGTPEFASLLQSAADLGIPHDPSVQYRSRHTVLRGMRFHFTEWGDPDAPAVRRALTEKENRKGSGKKG